MHRPRVSLSTLWLEIYNNVPFGTIGHSNPVNSSDNANEVEWEGLLGA